VGRLTLLYHTIL